MLLQELIHENMPKMGTESICYEVLQLGLITVISIPLLGGREERGSSLIKQRGPELGAKCLIFHLFKSASVD